MGKQRTELLLQRREHEHQLKMKMLGILESDPEAKYFIGALGGFGISTLNEYLIKYGYAEEGETEDAANISGWSFIPSSDLVSGILTDSGKTLSTFCIAILIIKSIFGEGGLNSLL